MRLLSRGRKSSLQRAGLAEKRTTQRTLYLSACLCRNSAKLVLGVKRLFLLTIFLLMAQLLFHYSVTLDEQLESLLAGGNDALDPNGYVVYTPHSGFHNQRIAFENALLISLALNRTLVLSPVILGHPVPWQSPGQIQDTFKQTEFAFRNRIVAASAAANGSKPASYSASSPALLRWNDIFDLQRIHRELGVRMIPADLFLERLARASLTEPSVWRLFDYSRRAWAVVDQLPFVNASINYDTVLFRASSAPLSRVVFNATCSKLYLIGNVTSTLGRDPALTSELFLSCPEANQRVKVLSKVTPVSLTELQSFKRFVASDILPDRANFSHFHAYAEDISHGTLLRYKLLLSPYDHLFNLQSVQVYTEGGPLALQFGSLFGGTRLLPLAASLRRAQSRLQSLLVPKLAALDDQLSKIEANIKSSASTVLVGLHLRLSDGPFAKTAQDTVFAAADKLQTLLEAVERLFIYLQDANYLVGLTNDGAQRIKHEYVVYVATDSKNAATAALFAPLRMAVLPFARRTAKKPFTARLVFQSSVVNREQFGKDINSYFLKQYLRRPSSLSRYFNSSVCGPTEYRMLLNVLSELPTFKQPALTLNASDTFTNAHLERGNLSSIYARSTRKRLCEDLATGEACIRKLANRNAGSAIPCNLFPDALVGQSPTLNMAKYFVAWLDLLVPVRLAVYLIGTQGSTFSGYMERVWKGRKESSTLDQKSSSDSLVSLLQDLGLGDIAPRAGELPAELVYPLVRHYSSAQYVGGPLSVEKEEEES